MIAYLIGGPNDLTKLVVDDSIDRFEVPSMETTHYFPTGEVRPTPKVKTHRYRRISHRLMDQFYIFYYEGTW